MGRKTEESARAASSPRLERLVSSRIGKFNIKNLYFKY